MVKAYLKLPVYSESTILKLAGVHVFVDACCVVLQQTSSFYLNEGKARLLSRSMAGFDLADFPMP